MNRVALLIKAASAFRAGNSGDAAACKAVALTAAAYPAVARQLDALDHPLPDIKLAMLRGLPPGSFGRRYADFMDRNGLKPLQLSPRVATGLASKNLLAVRYVLLHDAFHVLLDLDVSLPGELGVWSFVAAQHYTPTFGCAASVARLAYALAAPSQTRALQQAHLRGHALGSATPAVIGQPLDQFWSDPLVQVRERVGLTI